MASKTLSNNKIDCNINKYILKVKVKVNVEVKVKVKVDV